jgi:hypothetical protein
MRRQSGTVNSELTPADESVDLICEMCKNPVVAGPEGGYVCGLCYHVVEPHGYAERRAEGVRAAAEARRARTLARRARKP